jgi:hypothetical protein
MGGGGEGATVVGADVTGGGGTVVGAGMTGGGGGGTVVGARVNGCGGGTVVGAGEVTGGAGRGIGAGGVRAGMVTRAGERGAVVADEAAPFIWPAGTPLVVAAREPEVSANARLIPPAATRTIKPEMIPRRLVI